MIKHSKAENIFNVFNVLLMFGFLILLLVPLVYVLKMSLDKSSLSAGGLSLIPGQLSDIYYRMVLTDKGIYRPFLNSAYITIYGTVISLIINSMGAYALAQKDLPGNKAFSFLIVFSLMFSGGLVPEFLLIKYLGLMNSYSALVFPGLVNGMHIILFRNYYASIPVSLQESARIDGASEITIFLRIIFPLSAPIVATISLFTMVAYWNTFFSAVLYINDAEKMTFTVKLREMLIYQEEMQQRFNQVVSGSDRNALTNKGVSAAMVVISILPIIAIYPYLQKHFTKGIMLGSVKG